MTRFEAARALAVLSHDYGDYRMNTTARRTMRRELQKVLAWNFDEVIGHTLDAGGMEYVRATAVYARMQARFLARPACRLP